MSAMCGQRRFLDRERDFERRSSDIGCEQIFEPKRKQRPEEGQDETSENGNTESGGTQEWETARQQLLVREKELTRARDALAAERRRMPWLAVEKDYEFDGPEGKVSLPICSMVAVS